MKKILTVVALACALPFVAPAQSKSEDSNCYIIWAQKFEERGADEVEDGTYTDVVLTFRTGSAAECFTGKAEVKDGKIQAMYLRLEDGTYEPVTRKWKYEVKDVTITNGISKTLITKDDVLINVLFIKKIKPKKKGYEKAPVPSEMD